MQPAWLTVEVVTQLHIDVVVQYGGPTDVVRDANLLGSAVARPQQLHAYSPTPPSMAALAAAYAVGIVRNHPFVDGNKRSAFVAMVTFLRLNSWMFEAPQAEAVEAIVALADKSLTEDEFTAWVASHASAPV